MREELTNAIRQFQSVFGISLSDQAIDRLADYYKLVQTHNEFLHLVGPCPAEEFAVRHVLESLTLLEHLPHGTKFADVGTGAGLPSIPCLLVRDDLRAVLIESKEKKSKFLDLAVNKLGIRVQVEVVAKQFQEVDPADCELVTCRALDRFTRNLGRLMNWTKQRQLLLFGGPNLRENLETQKVRFTEKLMPMSEQRYLFVLKQ